MKKMLTRNHWKHMALGCMLTLVSVSTLWAATAPVAPEPASANSAAQKVCLMIYAGSMDPYSYVIDCRTCTRVYGVEDADPLEYSCFDGVWD